MALKDRTAQGPDDATARRKADAAALSGTPLETTTRLLQAVMDGATDAIFLKDTLGTYLLFNRAAGAQIGQDPRQVIGHTASDIFGVETGRLIRECELEVMASGKPITREETLAGVNGPRINLVTRSPYFSDSGKIVGLIGISRDITEMKQAEQDLRQSYEAMRQAALEMGRARDEAEAAGREKASFLATMSHEIRTPMNTIIGMTRLALNTELSPRQLNYLEKVESSARALLSIINDVLDFSRIEAGGLRLENTEFQLDAVLSSVADVTGLKAEEKGLELVFSVAPEVPEALVGDPLRLGQILINLVGNAVKFTHAGEVNVRVRAQASREEDRVTLQFSVEDTGIGLDPAQIDDLFRAFSQLRPDISRRYGGTGLGLAICRQLVDLMGGRIWAEGQIGRGSAFHFVVELRAEPQSVPAAAAGGHAPLRVLIAEDNGNTREALAAAVRAYGMLPAAVATGEEAMAALHAGGEAGAPFHLLLLDWRLPDVEGLKIARRMQASPQLRRVPVVLLTAAFGRDELLQNAELQGLAGVLVKPVTRTMLRTVLAQALPDAASSGALPPPAPAPATRPGRGLQIPPDARQRLSGRRVLVVDDNALNREVVAEMLRAVGMQVDMAVSGLDALRRLGASHHDCVLMDMHMPEMDGLNAVTEIRRQERFRGLPVIALSAQVMAEDRELSLAAGMNDYLTKPIEETQLYQTLLRLLPAAPSPAPAGVVTGAGDAGQHPADDTPATPPSPVPRLFSLERLGSDPVRLKPLLSSFLDETADLATTIAQQIAVGQLKEAAATVHSVRGSAMYMNATAVFESATELERQLRAPDSAIEPDAVEPFRMALEDLRQQIQDYVAGA